MSLRSFLSITITILLALAASPETSGNEAASPDSLTPPLSVLTGGCSTTGVDTPSEFVDLVDCLFAFERDHSLAQLSPAVQARFSPYVSILNSGRAQFNSIMKNQLLPAFTPQQNAEFSQLITTSGVLDEADAYITFLNTPVSTPRALQDEKNAKAQFRDTLQKIINYLIDQLPDDEFWKPIKATLKELAAKIFEILNVLGKTGK